MNKEALKWFMSNVMLQLEQIDKEVSNSLLQDEQFVLDFYDKLNEISVRKKKKYNYGTGKDTTPYCQDGANTD